MNVEQLEKEIKRLRDQPEAVFDSNKWMVESHRTLALAQLEVALHTARLADIQEAEFYLTHSDWTVEQAIKTFRKEER